jgi:cobyrinic acid a,c-diamide synthase
MSRVLISAAHKSSGKTTVSIGLCAALRQRGQIVQPFKKGPDYIDPMWLSTASGRACRNLDFYLMSGDEIVANFARYSAGADFSLIEGNKGLYDGLNLDGSNSNAALATLLQAPVVLVIDARGMTRGIAPLILGYQAFDPEIRIAGVILNRLGGARHESKLRAVIEHYTDVPVIGAVHHDPRLEIVERHLGLMPSNEAAAARQRTAEIGALVGAQVDLDRLLQVGRAAPALPRINDASTETFSASALPKVKVGLVRDRAFGFYYADDLDALEQAGAELVLLDATLDTRLPPLDGLFIGGGFPELLMDELEVNVPLRAQLRDAIENGLPVYAECGGLMYLARSLTWRGKTRQMTGVIPGDVVMHDKPVGRGYVRLRETAAHPWPDGGNGAQRLAHEFHYSSLENLPDGMAYAYEVERGTGIDGKHDGLIYKNLLASYAHFRSLQGYNWARRFIAHVRRSMAS